MPYDSKQKTPATITNILHSIEVRPIFRSERDHWDRLMREKHYLGFKTLVGESIRYVALYEGKWVALIGWSAAALKCRVRDQWIGWSSIIKEQRLKLLANNNRFLILTKHMPNLASRILSLNLKRLSTDWQRVYGHPIWIVETFVDPRYFQGTCYRASGWEFLGKSRGFRKRSNGYVQHDNPKMVFVRSLKADARQKLKSPYLKIKLNRGIISMKLSEKHAKELIRRLLQVPEPRHARGIRHKKISVLAVSICAILCGAKSFAAIAEWGQGCTQNMLGRLWCKYDKKTNRYIAPSEPTIRRFLQSVDAEAIDEAIYGWLQLLSGNDSAVSIDGKTLRGARKDNGKQVHLVSVFLHNIGTTVAQCEVDDKTNEIPVVRTALLESLDVEGAVVTLDAMHTQKETARYIAEDKKADYLFTVKDNQETLKNDIKDLQMEAFPPSAH